MSISKRKVKLYCKQKMSADAIARAIGIDGNVIRRRLRELNIPIRKNNYYLIK